MSTQLDPVTGAPLLTPDLGNIDQLPYKVQPVPLQDQTNQPQLGRAYLYPDDVPPVLANINAMNGTQPDQAQTLHTDGEHRLLVASSGGGGGLPPATYFNALGGGAIGATGSFAGGDLGIWGSTLPTAVTSAHIQFTVTAVGGTSSGPQVLLYLASPDHDVQIPLLYYIVGDSANVFGDGRYIFERVFLPPLDIAATFGAGIIPVIRFSSVSCTWSGAYRFVGLA